MLISSLFSLLAGLLVLNYFVKKLWRAWFGSRSERQTNSSLFVRFFSFGVAKLLAQKESNLNSARFSFSQNDLADSQKKIIQSFIFGKYSYFVFPENLHKQHLKILDSLLSFSQSKGVHVSNLAKIEGFIDQLSQVHLACYKESQSIKKAKTAQAWAKKELVKKRKLLKKQLGELEKAISKEVNKFFKELKTMDNSNYTVH